MPLHSILLEYRKDKLDEAALRPGHFDKHIEIPLPTFPLREKLWELFLLRKPLSQDIDLKALAKASEGFSGAEISGAVEEATDQLIDRLETGQTKERMLTQEDLLVAIRRICQNKIQKTAAKPKPPSVRAVKGDLARRGRVLTPF